MGSTLLNTSNAKELVMTNNSAGATSTVYRFNIPQPTEECKSVLASSALEKDSLFNKKPTFSTSFAFGMPSATGNKLFKPNASEIAAALPLVQQNPLNSTASLKF